LIPGRVKSQIFLHPNSRFAHSLCWRRVAPQEDDRMFKVIAAAALVCVSIASIAPADAHVCRNSHGRHFGCHKVIAPRINLKAKHPIKIQRCRGQNGRFNNC